MEWMSEALIGLGFYAAFVVIATLALRVSFHALTQIKLPWGHTCITMLILAGTTAVLYFSLRLWAGRSGAEDAGSKVIWGMLPSWLVLPFIVLGLRLPTTFRGTLRVYLLTVVSGFGIATIIVLVFFMARMLSANWFQRS